MNRLRSAIYRYRNIAMMFLYTVLAPCSATECNYITLTLAGVIMLVGIVLRRRWVTLLTLGALCFCFTYSCARLDPLPTIQATFSPCGIGPCVAGN